MLNLKSYHYLKKMFEKMYSAYIGYILYRAIRFRSHKDGFRLMDRMVNLV